MDIFKKRYEQIVGKAKKQKELKRKVRHQFQEIALEMIEEWRLPKDKHAILFRFIKVQLNKGKWWKIKQVREQMRDRGITSINYFMKAVKDEREGDN